MFPGHTGQCERLLYRASHIGDISTIKKLVNDFLCTILLNVNVHDCIGDIFQQGEQEICELSGP